MTNITVYVKSCALGATGIHWRNASQEDQSEETPELLKKRIIPKKTSGEAAVNYLIIEEKDEPTLILIRDEQELLLQVTGFESPKRTEQMGRKVFNSLAWVVDNNDEGEARIRYIAAQVLGDVWLSQNSELQKIVDQAVTFDGKEAFKVDLEKINQFTQGKASQGGSTSTKYCIQQYSEDEMDEILKLRDELQKQKLPKQWKGWHEVQDHIDITEGVLVIVTNWLPYPGILHKAGVWRGFAGDVKEPEKKIQPAPPVFPGPTEEKNSNPKIIYPSSPQKPSNRTAILIVAITILLLGVAGIILFPHPQTNPDSPRLTKPPKPKKPVPVNPLENKTNSQQEQKVLIVLIAPEI